jgi:hypothetical protein
MRAPANHKNLTVVEEARIGKDISITLVKAEYLEWQSHTVLPAHSLVVRNKSQIVAHYVNRDCNGHENHSNPESPIAMDTLPVRSEILLTSVVVRFLVFKQVRHLPRVRIWPRRALLLGL